MNSLINKFRQKYKDSYLLRTVLLVTLVAIFVSGYDALFKNFSFSTLRVYVVFVAIFIFFYVMTIRYRIRLFYQWIEGFAFILMYFIGSGYLNKSTVDWTSYVIYILTSLALSFLLMLIPLAIKQDNK
ncbi:hypothetical protein [Enterococcus raffinosus]|uniref:hypothetical protein n=1 Tax=Enterococcus raffinosus TaxID=71452 RepID=UPI003DA1E67F